MIDVNDDDTYGDGVGIIGASTPHGRRLLSFCARGVAALAEALSLHSHATILPPCLVL